MSARVPELVFEADNLPYPAVKLIITRCFQWNNNPPFWALLITGKFYNAAGRVIWSTEVFLGQFSWLDDADYSSQGDTQSVTETDSSSDDESSHSITQASQQDTESEADEEQSDSEHSSGEKLLGLGQKATATSIAHKPVSLRFT